MRFSEIAALFDQNYSKEDFEIDHLLFDSRQVIFPEKSLFFAFESPNNNGHRYILELISKGLKAFVVRKENWKEQYPNAHFLKVDDVLEALQKIAAHHRSKFDIPLIAITGSNGKTIIKEWLSSILSSKHQVAKNPKSYNSQIGVPFSLSLIRSNHNIGIFEAGISRKGEMEKLEKLIHPQIGMFTNIGSAHDAGFLNRQEKIEEKARLFDRCEQIIYCKDHQDIHKALQKKNTKLISWSSEQEADLRIVRIEKEKNQSTLTFEYQKGTNKITYPFTDEASIENCNHCLLASLRLGIPFEDIQEKMLQLKPIAMRLEVLQGENNCLIINDSYNSDLESLSAALQFLNSQQLQKKKVLILSDFHQFGEKPASFYAKVAEVINQNKIHSLFTIGEEIVQTDPHLKENIERRHFAENKNLEEHFDQHPLINAQVLIKGSRTFAFENISQILIKKHHQAKLEINLSALANNYDYFKNKLYPSTKMLCMVKASGYGSGGVEIAKVLANKNCDYLGVAYLDEGVELREAGIELPILVLNSDPSSCKRFIQHKLEPEIYSLQQLDEFVQFLPYGKSLKIHLKIDTGMHRLGIVKEEIPMLIDKLKANPQLKIASIMSHLAASESSSEDAFTHQQAQSFSDAFRQINADFSKEFTRHIVNSAGILRFPQYHFEMVRLGIGLYGVSPMNKGKNELETVLSLKANISQIKTLKPGDTVGYSRKGMVEQATQIGIVNIGYADGLLRKAGNGAFSLLVNGQKAPTVGNICMDMCMIDITDLANVAVGDEVLIFGEAQPVEQLSKVLDTIPYEIFTSISERVKRVYYKE